MPAAIAAALVVAAALVLYLTAPRQQLLRRALPRLVGWSAAAACLAAGWLLRSDALAPHTHVLSMLTLLMLAWGLLPHAVWWLRRRGA